MADVNYVQPFEELAIAANGMRFPTLAAGDGPLVVCLHGFPDGPRTWSRLLTALARSGFRAIAPYLRGYVPENSAPDGSYQSWATGGDVLGLIEALGYRNAVVIGHDWGASAAYAAAAMRPHFVSRLVTLAVPYGIALRSALLTDGDQQRRSWYWFFFQHGFAEEAISFRNFAFIDRLWAEWSPGYLLPDEDRSRLKSMLSSPGVLEETLAYYRQLFSPPPVPDDRKDEASRIGGPISVPALYLHGANDGCIGAYLGEGMEELFPKGLRRVVLPEAGHFLHLEQPEQVEKEILTFISDQK